MKKSLIVLFLTFSVGTFTLFSQINVTSNGRAYIGGTDAALFAADTADLIPLRVVGIDTLIGGQKKTPARIAFGELPSAVSMGEMGYNNPRIRIYGEGGIYASVKQNGAEKTIFYYETQHPMKTFFIDADQTSVKKLYYTSLVQPSDQRFKKNIRSLGAMMDKLNQLQGVTYQLDISESPLYNSQYTQQESMASDTPPSARTTAIEDTTKHIGFIAQELQEVFPELVTTDNEGNLYVDYVSLIPVIVEALKEQQTVIDAQNEKMEELEATVRELQSPAQGRIKQVNTSAGNEQDGNITRQGAVLYQNTPNPFGQSTQIRYTLPSETPSANIYIFNLQGTLLKNYPVEGAGEGTLEIQAADLQPGMYIYSLMIDNREIDTKRMVVTQ